MFPIETAGSFQKINYTEFIRIDGMAKYGVWHDLTSNINFNFFSDRGEVEIDITSVKSNSLKTGITSGIKISNLMRM